MAAGGSDTLGTWQRHRGNQVLTAAELSDTMNHWVKAQDLQGLAAVGLQPETATGAQTWPQT